MLYYLLYPLHQQISAFRVFRYITFRSAIAVFISLVVIFLIGKPVVEALRRMKFGQHIREEGPEAHKAKEGTPTMGGVLILAAISVAALLCARLDNPFPWIILGSTLLFGGIGLLDDLLKLKHKQSLGLRAWQKFSLQVVVASAVSLALFLMAQNGLFETTLTIPFFKDVQPQLSWLFIPFGTIVIVGASNAVNLTDGLDGLAIGSTLIAAGTYVILAYAAGNAVISGYLGIPFVSGTGELTVFAAAIVGACLGFLWFNAHPAQVFMGDVGSLALGAAIGTIALAIKEELLLVVVGGLFVMEALSVIIQVASFKSRGKRVFRCAPIHHHFELGGWTETQVVIRFWIIAILFALAGLATLKIR